MSDLDILSSILNMNSAPQVNNTNNSINNGNPVSAQDGYLNAAQHDALTAQEQAEMEAQNNNAMSLLDMALLGEGALKYSEDASAMDDAGAWEYTQALGGGIAEGATTAATAPAALTVGAVMDTYAAADNAYYRKLGLPTKSHNYMGELVGKANEFSRNVGDSIRSDEQLRYRNADIAKRKARQNHNIFQYERDIRNGMGEAEASTRDFLRSAWTGVENYLDSPTSFIDTTGQLIGELGVQGLGAKGLSKLTGLGASKLGRGVTQTSMLVGTEAASGIGNAAEAIDKMSDKELLNQSPEFFDLYVDSLREGKSYEQAIKDARTELKRQASVTEAIGSGLSALVGAKFAKPLDKFVPTGAGSATKGLIKDMSSEGLEEAITGFGQGLSSNIAARQTYNPEQRLLENVGEQVTEGALAGATGSGALRAPGAAIQGYDNVKTAYEQKQEQARLEREKAKEEAHTAIKTLKAETKAKVESPTAKVDEQAKPIPTTSTDDPDATETVPYKDVLTDDGKKVAVYDDPDIDDPTSVTTETKTNYNLNDDADVLDLVDVLEIKKKILDSEGKTEESLKKSQEIVDAYERMEKNVKLREKYATDIVRNSADGRGFSPMDLAALTVAEVIKGEKHTVKSDDEDFNNKLNEIYGKYKDLKTIYETNKAALAKINTPEQASKSNANLQAYTVNLANGSINFALPQVQAFAAQVKNKSTKTAQEEAFLKVYDILNHARGKIFDLNQSTDTVSDNVLTTSSGNKTSLNDYISSISSAIAKNDTKAIIQELNRLQRFAKTRINKIKALQDALINNDGKQVQYKSVNPFNGKEFDQSIRLGSFRLLDTIQAEQEAAVDIYNNISNIVKSDSNLSSNIPSESFKELSVTNKLANEKELKDTFAATHFKRKSKDNEESTKKDNSNSEPVKKEEPVEKSDADKAKDIVDKVLTPEDKAEPTKESATTEKSTKELTAKELMAGIDLGVSEDDTTVATEPTKEEPKTQKEATPVKEETTSKEEASTPEPESKDTKVEDTDEVKSEPVDKEVETTDSTTESTITKAETKEDTDKPKSTTKSKIKEEDIPEAKAKVVTQTLNEYFDPIDEEATTPFMAEPPIKYGEEENTLEAAIVENVTEADKIPAKNKYSTYNNFVQSIRNFIFKSRKSKNDSEESSDIFTRIEDLKDKTESLADNKEISQGDLTHDLDVVNNFSNPFRKFLNDLLDEKYEIKNEKSKEEEEGKPTLNIASWIRTGLLKHQSAAYCIFGVKKNDKGNFNWPINRDRLFAVFTQFNKENKLEFNPQAVEALTVATLSTVQLMEQRLTYRKYDQVLKELEAKGLNDAAIRQMDERERLLFYTGIPLDAVVENVRRQFLNALRLKSNPDVSMSYNAEVVADTFAQLAVQYMLHKGMIDFTNIYFDADGNKLTQEQVEKINQQPQAKRVPYTTLSYASPTTVYNGMPDPNKNEIKVEGHEFKSRVFAREFENLFNLERNNDVYYSLEEIPKVPEHKLRSDAKHTEAEKSAIANREKTPYMLDKGYHSVLEGLGKEGVLEIAGLETDPNKIDFNGVHGVSVESRRTSTIRELEVNLDRAKQASLVNPENPTIYHASVMNRSGRNQELTAYGPQGSKLARYLFSTVKSAINILNLDELNGFKRAVLQAYGIKIKKLSDAEVSQKFDKLFAKLLEKYGDRDLLNELTTKPTPALVKELYSIFEEALGDKKENPWLGLSAIINMLRFMQAVQNDSEFFENTLTLEFDGSCNGFANSHMKLSLGDSISSKSISALYKSNMYIGLEDEDPVDASKTLKEDNYTSNAQETQNNIQNLLTTLRNDRASGNSVPKEIPLKGGGKETVDELDLAIMTYKFIGAIMGNLVKVNYQALMSGSDGNASDLISIARIIVKFPTTRNNYGQGKAEAVMSAIKDLSDELGKRLTNIVQNKNIPPCEAFFKEEIESGEMTKEQALERYNEFVDVYNRLCRLSAYTETSQVNGKEVTKTKIFLSNKLLPGAQLLRKYQSGELATKEDIENFKKFNLKEGYTFNDIFKRNLAKYFTDPMYDAIQASKSEGYVDFSNKLATSASISSDSKKNWIIARLTDLFQNREPKGTLPSQAELDKIKEEADVLFPTGITTISMSIDTAGDGKLYQDEYVVTGRAVRNLKVESPIEGLNGRKLRGQLDTKLSFRLPRGNGIAPVALVTIATGDGTMQTLLFNNPDNPTSSVDRYDGVDTDPALYKKNAELTNKASYDILKELPTKSYRDNIRTYYATAKSFLESDDPQKFNIIVDSLKENDPKFAKKYERRYGKEAQEGSSKNLEALKREYVLKYIYETYVLSAEAAHNNAVVNTITYLSLPTSMHHMSSGPDGYLIKDPRDTYELPPGLTMQQKIQYVTEEANRRRAIIAKHTEELVRAYDERGELNVPPEVYENIPKVHAPEPAPDPEKLTEQDEIIDKLLEEKDEPKVKEATSKDVVKEEKAPEVDIPKETKEVIEQASEKELNVKETELSDTELERKNEEQLIKDKEVEEMHPVDEVATPSDPKNSESTIGTKELVSSVPEKTEKEISTASKDGTVESTASLDKAAEKRTVEVQPEKTNTSSINTGRINPILQKYIDEYLKEIEELHPDIAPVFKNFFINFVNNNIDPDLKVIINDNNFEDNPIVYTDMATTFVVPLGLSVYRNNAIYINLKAVEEYAQNVKGTGTGSSVAGVVIHELVHSIVGLKNYYIAEHPEHKAYEAFNDLYNLAVYFREELRKKDPNNTDYMKFIEQYEENLFNFSRGKAHVVNEFIAYMFNDEFIRNVALAIKIDVEGAKRSLNIFDRFTRLLQKIFGIKSKQEFEAFSNVFGAALTLGARIQTRIKDNDIKYQEHLNLFRFNTAFRNFIFELKGKDIREFNTKLYDILNDPELSKLDLILSGNDVVYTNRLSNIHAYFVRTSSIIQSLHLPLDNNELFLTASLSALLASPGEAKFFPEYAKSLDNLCTYIQASCNDKNIDLFKLPTDGNNISLVKERLTNLKQLLTTAKNEVIKNRNYTNMINILALLNTSESFKQMIKNLPNPRGKDGEPFDAMLQRTTLLGIQFFKNTVINAAATKQSPLNFSSAYVAPNTSVFQIKETLDTLNKFASVTEKMNDYIAAGDSHVSNALDKTITKALESKTYNKMLKSDKSLAKGAAAIFSHLAPLFLHDDNPRYESTRRSIRENINQYAKLSPGFMSKLFTTAHKELGSADSNADSIYAFEKQAKAVVQANRNNCREVIPQKLKDLFKKEKAVLSETDSATLNTVILTADLGALTDQEVEILFDRGLSKELNRVANKLDPKTREYCRALAHYIVTGYGSSGMLRNANAIARAVTRDSKGIMPQPLVHVIDAYTTLLVLNEYKNDFKVAQEIYSKAPKAFKFVLAQQRILRENELAKITGTDGGVRNAYKGYYPRDRVNLTNTILVAKGDVEKYESMGYTVIGTTFKGDKNYYMSSTINPLSTFDQGALQTVTATSAGVDNVTGWSVGHRTIYRSAKVKYAMQIMPTNANEFAFAPQKEAAIPVFDDDGEIKGFEYLADPEMFANEVRETDFAVNLGNWTGRQIEEDMASSLNAAIIKELAKQYDEADSETRNKEFVDIIALSKKDPVLKQALDNIPIETIRYMNEWVDSDMRSRDSDTALPKEWFVRQDLIDDIFGRRQASVIDLNTGITRWSPRAQRVFSEVVKYILGPKAYKYLYYTENMLKSLSSSARNFIVIRSGEVMAFNIIGNIMSLMIRGIPLMTIIKEAPKIIKELEYYNRSRKRRAAYRLRLNAELGRDKPNKKRVALLKKLIEKEHKSYESLPYSKALLEAGEYNTIADIGTVNDDLLLSTGRFGEYIEKQVDKLPDAVKKIGKNIIVTKDTEIYRMLEKGTQYGDFVAKVILYKHLVEKKKIAPKDAISKVRYEFVNYDMLPGRSREYLENIGLLWFYNYKLRVCRTAMSMIKDNPLSVLISMFSPLALGVGTPLSDNFISKLVTNPLGSVGPKLFDIPWITNHMWYNLFDYFR